MVDTNEKCKCLNHEDKKLILRIIDETINRELADLRRIETMRTRAMKRPPFVGSFIGTRSYLLKSKEELKEDIESLKKRIEKYPRCTEIKQLVAANEPVSYANGKLFTPKKSYID